MQGATLPPGGAVSGLSGCCKPLSCRNVLSGLHAGLDQTPAFQTARPTDYPLLRPRCRRGVASCSWWWGCALGEKLSARRAGIACFGGCSCFYLKTQQCYLKTQYRSRLQNGPPARFCGWGRVLGRVARCARPGELQGRLRPAIVLGRGSRRRRGNPWKGCPAEGAGRRRRRRGGGSVATGG